MITQLTKGIKWVEKTITELEYSIVSHSNCIEELQL